MKRIKKRFTPLGFDHITLACWDREFWGKKLEWLGFTREEKQENADDMFEKGDYDSFWGAAFSLGNVRVFLVDPATVRLGKTYIEWFLKTRGNMQIIEIGVEVDSIEGAFQELRERGMSLTPGALTTISTGDVFGKYRMTEITMPLSWSFRWRLIERENKKEIEEKIREDIYASWGSASFPLQSKGIDHVAIAVRDLDQWVKFYVSLGFDIVYTPHVQEGDIFLEEGLIEGKESAMKTYALRRGDWTVALVEGVDRARTSQVTTYVDMHGDHSVHHAALLFPDLAHVVGALHAKGAEFRLSKTPKEGETVSYDHIIHCGEDYLGPLLQCFTKPLDRKWINNLGWFGMGKGKGGFFFELAERVPQTAKKKKNKQAFHDPTVKGLFRSIEEEDMKEDSGVVFPTAKNADH